MNKPLASLFAKHKAIVLFDCELTDSRMYLRVVNTRIQAEVKKGDIVRITKGNLKGREFAIFHVAPNSVEAKGCNPFYDKDESYVIVKEAPEDTGIKVGDTVRVIQNLYCYQRYHEWMEKFALTYAGRYAYGTSPSGGFIGKVVAKHKHGPSERMLYAIQDQVSDAVYLMDERGIEKVNE